MPRLHKDPRTKEEFLNKMLAFDYDGDIRKIGGGTSIVRLAPHIVRLTFPETGRTFDLEVHIPRAQEAWEV